MNIIIRNSEFPFRSNWLRCYFWNRKDLYINYIENTKPSSVQNDTDSLLTKKKRYSTDSLWTFHWEEELIIPIINWKSKIPWDIKWWSTIYFQTWKTTYMIMQNSDRDRILSMTWSWNANSVTNHVSDVKTW